MALPAVELGDLNTILRRGPAPMRNRRDWTQHDSDVLAHFIQVVAQIARSRWRQKGPSFTTKGDTLVAAEFPALEDFVYAAVYIRQLTEQGDALVKTAVQDRYIKKYLDCPVRTAWMQAEVDGFTSRLNGNVFFIGPTDRTVRELFDAFLYGACLMHPPDPNCRKRIAFLDIYDTKAHAPLLYALHSSLHSLVNHVMRLARVIYQDLAAWTNEHNLPLPNVRWHDRLFNVTLSEQCEFPKATPDKCVPL